MCDSQIFEHLTTSSKRATYGCDTGAPHTTHLLATEVHVFSDLAWCLKPHAPRFNACTSRAHQQAFEREMISASSMRDERARAYVGTYKRHCVTQTEIFRWSFFNLFDKSDWSRNPQNILKYTYNAYENFENHQKCVKYISENNHEHCFKTCYSTQHWSSKIGRIARASYYVTVHQTKVFNISCHAE